MRLSRRPALVTGLTSAAILSLALTGCGGGANASGTSAAAGDSVTCPNGKIRFGVEPFEDPSKLEPAYRTIADALGKELNCKVEVTVVDNYAAEVLAMKNGQMELGQFGPLGYVFAQQEAGAKALVSFGTSDGKLSAYTGGIWVPKDSPIQSIADLKGKSLALSEPGSTSGDALPRYAIRTEGLQDSDLKIQYAGGHPEALLALKNGKVDAAEINSQQLATSTAEGQFDQSQFRQIWTSEPIPNDPITVAGNAPQEFQDAVKKALASLPAEAVAEAAKYLDVEPAGQLIEVTENDYQPLADLAKTMGLTSKDA
ncbi:phosphate/phosphite/phosphonate ABC transporter substrate-binding protein [Galactobacter valiniphilus]|uniref:phosphate/phosphite/phosphonate ABC transporter substrate-binding protein n=1 Tax=Galactobacter valiniphilus TaxID=2676122 RepID=UPI0037358B9E